VSEFTAWAVSHMGPVKSGVIFNPDAPAEAYSDPPSTLRSETTRRRFGRSVAQSTI
jgi:hypothetical protein